MMDIASKYILFFFDVNPDFSIPMRPSCFSKQFKRPVRFRVMFVELLRRLESIIEQ